MRGERTWFATPSFHLQLFKIFVRRLHHGHNAHEGSLLRSRFFMLHWNRSSGRSNERQIFDRLGIAHREDAMTHASCRNALTASESASRSALHALVSRE